MAHSKGLLTNSARLNTFKYIRSDGEILPTDLAKKFFALADEILDGSALEAERRTMDRWATFSRKGPLFLHFLTSRSHFLTSRLHSWHFTLITLNLDFI